MQKSKWPIPAIISIVIVVSGIISSYAVSKERIDTLKNKFETHCEKEDVKDDRLAQALTDMKVQLGKIEQSNNDLKSTIDKLEKKIDRLN